MRAFEAAVRRFDGRLHIPAESVTRGQTRERLAALRPEAGRWLETRSSSFSSGARIDFSSRDGDPRLWDDLRGWLVSRDLWEIEDEFSTRFVSNPHSGECVKGHRIVLAELGLATYDGAIVRDPALFDGAWSRAARAEHILARMAFVQELFARIGEGAPMLYRGISAERRLEERPSASFVSATFSREVAMSMITPGGAPREGVLYQQRAPLDRLFMTYLETAHMNRQFKEAEAVLLDDPGGALF